MEKLDKILIVVLVVIVVVSAAYFSEGLIGPSSPPSSSPPVRKPPSPVPDHYITIENVRNKFGTGQYNLTRANVNGTMIGIIFGNQTNGNVGLYRSYTNNSKQIFCMCLQISSSSDITHTLSKLFFVESKATQYPYLNLYVKYSIQSTGANANDHLMFLWVPNNGGAS